MTLPSQASESGGAGAFAEHTFLGDGLDKLMPPVFVLSALIGSDLLRPASQRSG